MAVDTHQQSIDYEQAVEHIRKLCEGEASDNSSGSSTIAVATNGIDSAAVNGNQSMATKSGSTVLRSSSATAKRQQQTNGSSTGKQNQAHDVCDTCGQTGKFICCEMCPRVFHFLCVQPPMTQESVRKVGHWYCRACEHLVTRKRKSRAHAKNIFYPLISNMEFANARVFVVPEDIRRQFDGVEADVDGTFISTREDRPQRVNLGPHNRDFSRLVDDQNSPILCYRCNLSALHGPVVRCDYCPLNWHWDCLDPPLSSAPPAHRRWMCPNHADHAMPRRFKFRKERIVDQTNAPADARNSGIVDVVDDDPPTWHEQFDPKVKYRVRSSRIRQAFSDRALPCRLPTQQQKPQQLTGSTAEWLKSIVTFQQDVARCLLQSKSANDNIDVLSTVATEILSPLIKPTDVADERTAVEALNEMPNTGCNKRKRVLDEGGLTRKDLREGLDNVIEGMAEGDNKRLRRDTPTESERVLGQLLRSKGSDAVLDFLLEQGSMSRI